MKFTEEEIERLNKETEQLRKALNSKESIIKAVREHIEDASDNEYSYGDYEIHYEVKKELLEILDKVDKEKE